MNRIRLHVGDCLEVLKWYPDNSFDSVVTDPPYGLSYMSKNWDRGVPGVEFWREIVRVLKPGGYLAAFGGTRTYHRLACAIEDAGCEIRDNLNWVFGSGMPHSKDTSKAIDLHYGLEREVIGWKRGVGGENLNDIVNGRDVRSTDDEGGRGCGAYGVGAKQIAIDIPITKPACELSEKYAGYGSNLKPAHEPIVLARKPLIGTVAENVIQYGTGAMNIDGCRVAAEKHNQEERWPANVVITPTPEVLTALPESKAGYFNQFSYGDENYEFFYCAKAGRKEREAGLEALPARTGAQVVGRKEGSAGVNNPRAGAGRTARAVRNTHTTVKPIDLMAWLCRLITPPDGIVLDPFMGSGSTGIAAAREGFGFVGVDLDPEYVTIAQYRIQHEVSDAEEA